MLTASPALVRIDSLNIDDSWDGTRPAHTLLLGASGPVVEHLGSLQSLPQRGFCLCAREVPRCGKLSGQLLCRYQLMGYL
jgi:kynurenine formamidase